MKDIFGRTLSSLRVSVTDRCNFSCSYCMPESNVEWFPHEEILTYEELLKLCAIFADLGINKFKITGGEPLMRKNLHYFIKELSSIEDIEDISLTTNGYFLDKEIENLMSAGLSRITVSLDSLREDRFNRIVRRNIFKKIYANLLLLKEYQFSPVKINVVVIRGFNEDEILDFVEFACETGFIIRFIEFMPLDGDKNWSKDQVVSNEDILNIIRSKYEIEQVGAHGEASPADRFRLKDGSAELGFISSVSNPFCENCGRIRIMATGELRTCLFSHNETDLKTLLRSGADKKMIKDHLQKALFNKEEGHLIHRKDFQPPGRPMYQIGG